MDDSIITFVKIFTFKIPPLMDEYRSPVTRNWNRWRVNSWTRRDPAHTTATAKVESSTNQNTYNNRIKITATLS
jgi:hypothetical protein